MALSATCAKFSGLVAPNEKPTHISQEKPNDKVQDKIFIEIIILHSFVQPQLGLVEKDHSFNHNLV